MCSSGRPAAPRPEWLVTNRAKPDRHAAQVQRGRWPSRLRDEEAGPDGLPQHHATAYSGSCVLCV